MGMLGKLFDDGSLRDEGGEDGEGKVYRPRFDIDLDSGMVRLPNLGAARPAGGAPSGAAPAAGAPAPEPDDEPGPA
jgi:hypothetical protein